MCITVQNRTFFLFETIHVIFISIGGTMKECLIQTLKDTTGIAPARQVLHDQNKNFNQIWYIVLRWIRVFSEKLRKSREIMIYQSSSQNWWCDSTGFVSEFGLVGTLEASDYESIGQVFFFFERNFWYVLQRLWKFQSRESVYRLCRPCAVYTSIQYTSDLDQLRNFCARLRNYQL